MFMWQHKELLALPVHMVKSLSDIARHFYMLYLIAADRNAICLENEDISSHQYGIRKQAHIDALVGLIIFSQVVIYRSLVGMGTIHQPLGCQTSQQPT